MERKRTGYKLAGLCLLGILGNSLTVLGALEIPGLAYESSMELQYAENFSVDYYEGGYALLSIQDEEQIL